MENLTLKAEVREGSGKGPARQLRMKGLIPAVYYGPGKTPKNLAVAPEALSKLLSGSYGRNQVIELDLAGGRELAVVRDLEVHPVTRNILHADFYAVSPERKVQARVPFLTRGRAAGVQAGGRLRVIFRELPVVGAPNSIPDKIEVDVAPLDLHQSIKVKDIALPEGVTIALPAERPVVSVETKEKEKPEEGADAAAAGAPAAAAPAAKDAKAAAPAAKDAKKK